MQKLYQSEQACQTFTDRQNNATHASISKIIAKAIQQNKGDFNQILNLSGRGNPQFFSEILSQFDETIWLTPSQAMANLANKNKQEDSNLKIEIGNPISYLSTLPDESLQVVFMKYTIAEIQDIDSFFGLLSKKLVKGGKFIANLSDRNNIPRHSSNGSFFVNNELVNEDGLALENGQKYTVKFLKEYKNPSSGYIPEAELNFYYHNYETIKESIQNADLQISFFGNYQDLFTVDLEAQVETDLLILTKD